MTTPGSPVGPKLAHESQNNWDDFRLPVAGFFETSRNLKISGIVSIAFAALSGGATAYAALAFTATPIIVASSFSGLALLTIALAVAGIYFLRKGPSENDPEVCKQRARDAGKDIEAQDMGFEAIKEKYRHLFDFNLINHEVIRNRLAIDANNLTYDQFKAKHCTKSGIQLAYDFVSPDAKKILRDKYVQSLQAKVAVENNLAAFAASTLASFEAQFFLFNYQDLLPIVANQLHADAQNSTTFEQFNQRHTIVTHASYLRADTKTLLKGKYLQHLENNATASPGFRAILAGDVAKSLEITFEEVASTSGLANSEADKAVDYATFVLRNPREALDYVTNTSSKARLEKLFLDGVKAQTSKASSDLGGVVNITRNYAVEGKAFGGDILTHIGQIIFAAEQKRFMDGKLDYATFRDRNSLKWIQAYLQGAQPDYLAKLKSSFLSMPLDTILSAAYAEDRKMLNINEQEVRQEHIDQMNKYAEEGIDGKGAMKYLGPEGFKAKFGMELLEKHELSATNAATYKKEVTNHLLTAPLDQLDVLQRDMEYLGINRLEILKTRWTQMKIPQILASDKDVFFAEALSLFTREGLAKKVLSEVPTILEIVQLYPRFFTDDILLPQDALDGQRSVSTRLDNEIAGMSSLEELFRINAELIFDKYLLPIDNKKLNTLILQFMADHAGDLLTSGISGNAQNIWKTLIDCDRLPSATEKPLKNGREQMQAEEGRHAARKQEIATTHSEAISRATAQRDASIVQVANAADLQTCQGQVAAARQHKEVTARELQTRAQSVRNKQSELEQAQRHSHELANQQRELDTKQTTLMSLAARFPQLSQQYGQANARMQQLEQAQAHEIHSQTAAVQQQITVLEGQLSIVGAERDIRNQSYATIHSLRESARNAHDKQFLALNDLRTKLARTRLEINPARLAELDLKFKDEQPNKMPQVTGLKGVLGHIEKEPEREEWKALRSKAQVIIDLEAQIAQLEPVVNQLKSTFDSYELPRRAASDAKIQPNNQVHQLEQQLSLMRSNLLKVKSDIQTRYNLRGEQANLERLKNDFQSAQNASREQPGLSAKISQLAELIARAELAVRQIPLDIARVEGERIAAEQTDREAQRHIEAAVSELSRREKTLADQKRAAEELLSSTMRNADTTRDTQIASESSLHQKNLDNIVETFKKAIR